MYKKTKYFRSLPKEGSHPISQRMQTHVVHKMTQYDCTSAKILKASLYFFSLKDCAFFEEFLETVITEEIYAFLEMNFVKIVAYVSELMLYSHVSFLQAEIGLFFCCCSF